MSVRLTGVELEARKIGYVPYGNASVLNPVYAALASTASPVAVSR